MFDEKSRPIYAKPTPFSDIARIKNRHSTSLVNVVGAIKAKGVVYRAEAERNTEGT